MGDECGHEATETMGEWATGAYFYDVKRCERCNQYTLWRRDRDGELPLLIIEPLSALVVEFLEVLGDIEPRWIEAAGQSPEPDMFVDADDIPF